MDQGISLAASLGLPGLDIFDVAAEQDGSWTWHVASEPGRAVCCPDCGQVSDSPVEPVTQQVRHLVVVPVRVVWHKARFRCRDTGCGRDRFTETGPLVVPGGRVGRQAKLAMGRLVGDWLVPVSRVAAGVGVGWHTAHDGFRQVAADADVVVTGSEPRCEQVKGSGTPVTSSGMLPNARLIVDAFHVAQLANKMVGDVRRRVTFEHYGRRGRATDPEYVIKGLLVRGQERLTERARSKLLVALADLGEHSRQIGAA